LEYGVSKAAPNLSRKRVKPSCELKNRKRRSEVTENHNARARGLKINNLMSFLSAVEEGHANSYQLLRKLPQNPTTIMKYIAIGIESGLIELDNVEETGRGVGATKNYKLTEEGQRVLEASKTLLQKLGGWL
jgi:hypothetical protein